MKNEKDMIEVKHKLKNNPKSHINPSFQSSSSPKLCTTPTAHHTQSKYLLRQLQHTNLTKPKNAQKTTVCAQPDTAATSHFLPNGLGVACANGATMNSIATDELCLPHPPATAKRAHEFKEIQKPLLSIPVLADVGCQITFTNKCVTVIDTQKFCPHRPM